MKTIMMNIISKHKNKLRTTAAIAAAIGIILFAAALFVSIWWRVRFFTGLSVAFRMIITMLGIASIPWGFYFLMRQKNKFMRFCDIHDLPDGRKYDAKVMLHSLIKYLAVVFILTAVITASYGFAVMLAPLAVALLFVVRCIINYIKLWKYHGYSVMLLMCLTGVTAVISVILSPFFRAGVWAVIEAFLRFSNI